MFNISSYLEKFKNTGVAGFAAKEAFIKAVRLSLGIDLEKKNVEIKNGSARVSAHPLVRSQIQIKKKMILEAYSSMPEATHTKITDIK